MGTGAGPTVALTAADSDAMGGMADGADLAHATPARHLAHPCP